MKKTLLLIVCLLGLSSVSAQKPEDIRLKYNNPDLIVDLGTGLWGTPIPIDYDNDGVNDLISSCHDIPSKGLYFFKNIGTNSEPLFDAPKKIWDRAFVNTKASYANGELFVTNPAKLYRNFSEKLLGDPVEIKVDVNPNKDLKRVRSNTWIYTDYDSDGDLDILVGIDTWDDYGWDNAFDKNGNWYKGPLRGYVFLLENQDGNYINKGKILAGTKPLETFGAPEVNMADFDGDGKPDLVCGEFLDKLRFYKNIGTRTSPKFMEGKVLLDEKGDTIRLHVEMITPVAFDFDKDGHVDLIVGDEDGRVVFIKNTGKKKKGLPVFKSPVYFKQKADNLKFGALTTPFSVDWDGDGNEDIISGNSAGDIAFIKNLDGGYPPKWDAPVLLKSGGKPIRIMAGVNGSIQGPAEAKWGYTTLTVADWDNDGLKDILVNSIFGEIIWYKNTGDLLNLEGPYKVKIDWAGQNVPKPEWNWWNPGKTDLVTQWRTTPMAIDWNKDGLMDLVVLDQDGYLAYYERFEKDGELWLKPGKRVFQMLDVSEYDHHNRLMGKDAKPLKMNVGIAGKSGRRKWNFVDWNKDGRMDIVANSENVAYFENVKQEGDTAYFIYRGDLSNVILAGHDTSPTPVDWKKDGKPDLVVGGEDGNFYWIRNDTKTKK